MRKIIAVTLITLTWHFCHAQNEKDLSGNYYADGAPNGIKTGFYLNQNGTFKFFLSQPGVERYGSGRWETKANTIVFNGRMAPLRLFKLLSSRRVNDNFVTFQFTDDDNPALLGKIECILFTARGRQKLFTNAEGLIKFNKFEIDSVQIKAPAFPDHPFTFIPNNKAQNSFEFAFEKGIYEVYFEDFVLLNTTNAMLVGPHPVLKGKQFRYLKDE